MIKQISWADYAYAITILLLLYYLAVFLVYYYADARTLIINRVHASGHNKSSILFSTAGRNFQPEGPEALFGIAQNLIEQLGSIIQLASKKQYNKNDLLQALKSKISCHPQLKGTAFEVAVSNYITVESQINCSINLGDEDLVEIWQIR